VFLGTYTPRLDEKGRLILPVKFRSELEAGLVITAGQERCLYVFPAARFEAEAAPYADAPVTDRENRHFSRIFFSSAADERPDRQGRITIPATLRDYAGLSRDCVVIGAHSRVEIWDAGSWASYSRDHEEEFVTKSGGGPAPPL